MATLKSREILAERQREGAKLVSQYSDPDTWQKMAMKHKRVIDKPGINIIQNPLGVLGGVISDSIQTVLSGEVLQGTDLEGLSLTSGLSYTKLWRYKLLWKGSGGMEQTQWSPRPTIGGILRDSLPNFLKGKEPDSVNSHTTKTLSQAEKDYPKAEADKIIARRGIGQNSGTSQNSFKPAGKNYIKDKLDSLESFNRQRKRNEISIINASVSPYISLTLQNRPNEISIDPKSTWVAINSMGRNDPFLMYTGGETNISFEVQWFANDPERRDEVLWKCRLLESWSRADGYASAPPMLIIVWGGTDIFNSGGEEMTKDYFILESAKYTLSNFQDYSRAKITRRNTDPEAVLNNDYPSLFEEAQDLKLNPNCATQQLVFKRVSLVNRTHENIAPKTMLSNIKGIGTV